MTWNPTPEQLAAAAEDERRHNEHMAKVVANIAARKPADYFTRCRDCGVFVKKHRWVRKEAPDTIKRGTRPLCADCYDDYDLGW